MAKHSPLTDSKGEVRDLNVEDLKQFKCATEVLPSELLAAQVRKQSLLVAADHQAETEINNWIDTVADTEGGEGVKRGDYGKLRPDHDRLVVEPKLRSHYTLAELLAASDYSQPQPAEEREWVDALSVDGELI